MEEKFKSQMDANCDECLEKGRQPGYRGRMTILDIQTRKIKSMVKQNLQINDILTAIDKMSTDWEKKHTNLEEVHLYILMDDIRMQYKALQNERKLENGNTI